jgi:hypothetical protein
MDAPLFEIIVRVVTVIVALFAFVTVAKLWRIQREECHPARHLTSFMALLLFVMFLNRLYVLWVGLQHDTTGDYSRNIEPFVRAAGASLLGLLLLGAGLLATFYIRNRSFKI